MIADPAASPAAAPLSVILVDDEHLIRSALATMLSLEEDLAVLGEAGSVEEGARLAGSAQPDVAVVALQLPAGAGLDRTEGSGVQGRDSGHGGSHFTAPTVSPSRRSR